MTHHRIALDHRTGWVSVSWVVRRWVAKAVPRGYLRRIVHFLVIQFGNIYLFGARQHLIQQR